MLDPQHLLEFGAKQTVRHSLRYLLRFLGEQSHLHSSVAVFFESSLPIVHP